jgi:hypothetical protein
MIEVLVRFTEMKFKQDDSAEAMVRRVVDGDETAGMVMPEIYHETSPMVFDMDDISKFNRSRDTQFTTVMFKDGTGYLVKMPYEEFMNIYIVNTGRSIISYTEEPKNAQEDDLEL